MDDQAALKRFYELLVNVLQVIVTIMVSVGEQNKHALTTVRAFLTENRALMVGIFKRQARIVAYEKGAAEAEAAGALREAAELYVLLISLTGFEQVSDPFLPLLFSYGRFADSVANHWPQDEDRQDARPGQAMFS